MPRVAQAQPLFTRLMHEGVRTLLLSTQYRMHPAISQLPSDLFYAGEIADGIGAADRPSPAGFCWPRSDWPVALIPVAGVEHSEARPSHEYSHE